MAKRSWTRPSCYSPITLDVGMHLLNGVDALKRIMSECPCPVIMFSSATREGDEVTLEALSAGAFDYPAESELPALCQHSQTAMRLDREN